MMLYYFLKHRVTCTRRVVRQSVTGRWRDTCNAKEYTKGWREMREIGMARYDKGTQTHRHTERQKNREQPEAKTRAVMALDTCRKTNSSTTVRKPNEGHYVSMCNNIL